MKKTMILFGLVAATFMSCQNAPKLESNTGQRLLGTLEVSFGAENGKAKAMFTPSKIAGQALVNEAQLLFTAGTYSAATQTTPSRKFLNAQFSVRNLTGASLSNLTLVAYRKNGNIGNTALKNVTDFGGITTTSSKLRVATVASYAQTVRPSQTMSGNGTVAVVAGQEDLALFTEYDLSAMTTTAGTALASGEYLLPYGFTVRDSVAPTAATQRTITANNSTDTGTATLAMAVDGSNEPGVPTAYRFSYTALVFENPTPVTQVSASLEEKSSTAVVSRRSGLAPAEAVTLYSSGQNELADYGIHAAGQFANACQVRIAGTAAVPEAYLESIAPSVNSSDLSNCFGGGGVHTVFPAQRAVNTDVGLLSDGRIATVGTYYDDTNLTTGSYVATFLPDGSRQILRFSNAMATTLGSTHYTSLAIDSQNRIIRAGYSVTLAGVTQLVIGRSLINATLGNDTTFSSVETFNTQIYSATGSEHVINDIALQTDGKIVAVGRVKNGTAGHNDVLLIRYNTDGTLDTTFNTTGYRIDDVDGGSLDNQALSLLIDPSGNIVVAGKHNNPGVFLLMRFTSTGARDQTFNGIGHKLQGISGSTDDTATSVTLQGTKILFSGNFTPSLTQTGFALVRINNDGSLDTTFATGGELTYSNTNPPRVRASKIIVQPNNRILIAGTSFSGSTIERTFIARYLDTGAPDNSFFSNTIHIRFYTLTAGSIPLDTEVTSALLLGTPSNGKLLVSGSFNDSNILGNRRGMLAQFNLGAN